MSCRGGKQASLSRRRFYTFVTHAGTGKGSRLPWKAGDKTTMSLLIHFSYRSIGATHSLENRGQSHDVLGPIDFDL